jgi:PAS domain S-box-containing protein
MAINDELRQRAESAFRENKAFSPEQLETLSPDATRQMLHELGVHQIELEMQNEELRRAQLELDVSRARYFDLYDLAPVGYCTVSDAGQILQANLTAASLLGVSRGELVKQSITLFIARADQDIYYLRCKQLVKAGKPQSCELQMVKPDGTQFWAHLTMTVAQSDADAAEFRIVLFDITERRQAEEKNRRLTQFNAALSQCNEAIARCNREEELFSQICRVAVLSGGMKMAWISLVDAASQRVASVASYGEGVEYLEGIRISSDVDDPIGCGPIGIAIREKQPYWCQDFQHDLTTKPWHERAVRFGWGASASLPLYRNGVVIGVFTLYADETNTFDESVRDLLVEMAIAISYALDNFARESQHRQAEEQIHRLVERLTTTLESITDAFFTVDQEWRFNFLNQEAERLLGRTREELTGQEFWKEFPGTIGSTFEREYRRAMLNNKAVAFEEFYPPLNTFFGVRAYPSEQGLAVYFRDITEIKRAEEEIQFKNTILQTQQKTSLDAILVVDETDKIISFNHQFIDLWRVPPQLVSGGQDAPVLQSVADQIENPEAFLARVKYLNEHRDEKSREEIAFKDGKIIDRYSAPITTADGKYYGRVWYFRDISERKEVERELEESRAQLHGYLARREVVSEEERKYIAREVHDELGQVLTGLQLNVSVITHKFAADAPALHEYLQETMMLTNRALDAVRNVTSALRPAALEMGIVSALEWLAGRFGANQGIQCVVHVEDAEIQLDENHAIALYRIVQESLTNVARHAAASNVEITLVREGDDYVLKVHDNGAGFDASVKKKNSFGLVGIRERALMLAGTVSINSQSGIGTEVVVRIPINNEPRKL